MKIAVVNELGKELRQLDVDDSVFGITPNMAVLHQAYVTQRNNQRAGTVKTKTRGEVQGSTAKIRRQKYTGRARAGSNRAPTRVGGGLAFGPRPRSYARDFPKKMRRLAIRSALSGKLADGQLVVIDQLAMEKPKTQEMIRILQNVGFDRSALVITAQADRMVLASVRNMTRTKALPAAYLNVVDMLNHFGVLMTEDAVRVAEGLWAVKANGAKPAPRRKPVAAATAEAPARARSAKAEPKPEVVAEAAAPAEAPPAEEAPKPARASRARPKAAAPDAGEAPTTEARPKRAPRAKADAGVKDAPKPKRASTAKAKSAKDTAAAEGEAPKPRRRTTKKTEENE